MRGVEGIWGSEEGYEKDGGRGTLGDVIGIASS